MTKNNLKIVKTDDKKEKELISARDLEIKVLDLEDDLGVYIIYYLTDDDNYEFYAEVGKESRMEELLSDGEDKEEE